MVRTVGYRTRLISGGAIVSIALLGAACSAGESTNEAPPSSPASTAAFEPMPSLPPDSRITIDPLPVLLELADPASGSGPGYSYELSRVQTVRGNVDDVLAAAVWLVDLDDPAVEQESRVILTVHPTPAGAEEYALVPVRGVRCDGYAPLPQFSSTAMLCDADDPKARVLFTVDEVLVSLDIHAADSETVLGVVESLYEEFQVVARQVVDQVTA